MRKHKIVKPPRTKTAIEYFKKFDGGLNLFISENHLNKSEIPAMRNVEPDEDGIVMTRHGYTLYGPIDSTAVTGAGVLYKDDGSKYLLKAGGTKPKVLNHTTDTWDDVPGETYTAGLRTDFCQAYNKTFIQNGTDDLTYFDGSTTQKQTNGQKGEFCIYFNGVLVTNDPDNPSRVYFSGSGANIGDFSSGAGGEFIDINASDGDYITGFAKYGTGADNVLLVYKQRSTYKVRYDDAGLPVVETVSPSRGAECHWSIDNMEDDIMFFSNLPALMTQGAQENFFSQIRTNEMSLFVVKELLQMNQSRKKKTAGIYKGHRYYFAYSSGGQTQNNRILMYDSRYESWWLWEGINATCFTEYETDDGENHFLFGSDDGNIYEFDNSNTDNGTRIESYFETKAFNFGTFDRMKYFPFITVLFRNVIGAVKTSIIIDGETVKTKTLRIGITNRLAGFGASLIGMFTAGDDGQTNDEGVEAVVPRRFMIRKKGKAIKLRFENTVKGETFSVLDLSIAYKQKSIRRFNSKYIIR